MSIEVEKENLRLDQYLAEMLPVTRSKIQKLIKNGFVLVNDKVEHASYQVKIGDEIVIHDDLKFEIKIEKENIPLDIVYEDEYLLVINKKSGMVVHPAPGNYSHTLVNALLYHFDLKSQKDPIRPGIVHRLDKDTSGLMLVAKNDEVHDLLAKMIQNKEVERKYWALVDGIIMHETGTIHAPIGRDVNNRQKMMVTDENSKDAITHFKVLERFSHETLIECKLETGRTHQIRVHMAYIGYPIVNDPVYGKRKKTTYFHQLLHSKSIRFIHPITQKEMYFTSDLPQEFQQWLDDLRNV